MKQNTRFQHESLQDSSTLERLLGALVKGIAAGKIVLEDEDAAMVMEPKGLANLKISASQDEKRNRLNIRLTWYDDREPVKRKEIRVSSE